MEAKKLIDDLKAKGINLYHDGDKLKWRAQKGKMTNDLIAVLKKHKQELLTLVSVVETPPTVNNKGWKSRFAESRLQFIRGDFYPWCAANMKADSVDLILTDPPYPKKYLYLWDQLGEVAARVLKPGGILATYSGLYHLPYVLNALGKHLTYCWTIALRHGGKTQLVFARNVISTYKPILVYQKGSRKKFENAITDTITNDRKDKKYHKWGQGEDGVKKLMEMFSNHGDLVLDPFAGGGTTLAVASALGRRCIGIEVDADHFDTANERCKSVLLERYKKAEKPQIKPKVGFRDWTEPGNNVNICTGCENDCLYCYAKVLANRRKQVIPDQWSKMKIREHDVKKRRKLYSGLVGFPSTHDIFPSNIDAYLDVLGKLLHAGNHVLIVTKPRLDCIKRICEACQSSKEKIRFMFTIGAMDNRELSFWEPGAPNYEERKASLEYAYNQGYRTSVSMEPIVNIADIDAIIQDVDHFVTNDIWLGAMNYLNDMRKWADGELKAKIDMIETEQRVEVLAGIYLKYKHNPKIKWKSKTLKNIQKYLAGKEK